ncbi:MAG TPA: YrdB family protein [Anaerolineales bacterium]|nr:YrdB family protein [Anaerolineales bacterium]
MANHPLNLALRFLLELAGLFAYGYWGWTQHQGWARWAWAVGLPVAAALAWGVFRVPGDPGNAPVAAPGWARLLLEVLFFGGAVWALYASGRVLWAASFAVVVLAHYAVSYDRILWLLRK